MNDFTNGQQVTLEMMEQAASESKKTFDNLDQKAQELFNVGALILGLLGLTSVVAKGALNQEARNLLFGLGMACFVGVVFTVLRSRYPTKMKVSPMEPTKETATEWSELPNDTLWARLILQYEEVINDYRKENLAKKGSMLTAQFFLLGEIAFIMLGLTIV